MGVEVMLWVSWIATKDGAMDFPQSANPTRQTLPLFVNVVLQATKLKIVGQIMPLSLSLRVARWVLDSPSMENLQQFN